MCGRFTLKTPPDQWGQLLLPLLDTSRVEPQWQARYNIAPTQAIIAIVQDPATGKLMADYFRWGLVPSWASDLNIGNRMINARGETVSEKPSFRAALAKRRCAIVADGYYEWQTSGKLKQAYWVHRPNQAVFAMAGLWEVNAKATGQEVRSCTVITTNASQAISAVHDRMPVALIGNSLLEWVGPDLSAEKAQSMLHPADEDFFEAMAVSAKVNNARNEGSDCLQRV